MEHPVAVFALDEEAGMLGVRCIRCGSLRFLLEDADLSRMTLKMLRDEARKHLPSCGSAAARAALGERTGP